MSIHIQWSDVYLKAAKRILPKRACCCFSIAAAGGDREAANFFHDIYLPIGGCPWALYFIYAEDGSHLSGREFRDRFKHREWALLFAAEIAKSPEDIAHFKGRRGV